MNQECKIRDAVITRVQTLVLKHHFNIGKVDYKEWTSEVERRRPDLVKATAGQFEAGVQELLALLKSSHTNFLRADGQPTKPQHAIGATFRSVEHEGTARWMFLDVFEQSAAASAGIRPGDVLFSMNGKPAHPPATPVFRFGETHLMSVGPYGGQERRDVTLSVPARKASRKRPALVEPQPVAYRVVQPGVGLLKIPFFSGAFGMRFSKMLDSAIAALNDRHCDRLIVDLRGCLGGSLGFARLASYLCAGTVPIGYDVTRRRLLRGYDAKDLPRVPMPSTRVGVLACLLRFSFQDKSLVLMTQGLGPQPFHGRIAVLINEWTNSAGEMAAQFAKDAGLATVIGRTTMGNVLGSTLLDAGHGYRLYLPIFGWYSPSGIYTEGSGVEPDVEIDVTPAELACGCDAQLEKALQVVDETRFSTLQAPSTS